MKKSYFIMALGALALASCSQDEPVSINESDAISFRPAIGTISRATETTNANLSEITVASFLGDATFFPAMQFTKGSDGFFTSTPAYRWPGDDSELSFYAYSPETPGGTIDLTPDTKTLTGFSPAAELGDQIDFITSKATGTRTANEASGVELTFNHQLSQIEVRAKADSEIYTYKITGIRIAEPVSKGDYDFTTDAWTLGTDKAIYEDTYTTPINLSADATSVMGQGGNAMLIPQQLTAWDPTTDATNTAEGAYLAVKLQINTVAGAQVYPFPTSPECQWAAIPLNTNWQAGKKYIYTLDLTNGAGYVDPHDPKPGDPVLGGPIKFTVDVVDWVDTPMDLPMTTDRDTNE